MRPVGEPYSLGDGMRLQDVDAGCRECGKRLAEVIHDPTGCWPTGRYVCIDCGTLHRAEPRCNAIHPTKRCRCLYLPHGGEKEHVGKYRGGKVAYWRDAA